MRWEVSHPVKQLKNFRRGSIVNDDKLIRCCFKLLLVVHAAMLGYGAWIHGPGWDEGGHLPSGISHWKTGNTDAYRVNPPLVRMIATLPVAWIDFDLPDLQVEDTRIRPEWVMGHLLWRQHGRNAYWYLTVARWICIPWSLLAAYIIYVWGTQLYGQASGLFAAILWCFSPLVLANAQMMTPDTGAAAMGVAASYAFRIFVKNPTWFRAIDAGILLGVAQLTKFTWVVLFLLWPAIWAANLFLQRHTLTTTLFRRSSSQFLVIVLLAVVVINVGYGFEGTLERLHSYRFVSNSLTAIGKGEDATNRFSGTLVGELPVPLPRNYLLGIDRQKLDFESGSRSYLRGVWQDHGWWYYYLYGLLIKEPIGYLLLFTVALVHSVRRKWNWESVFLVLPGIVVFLLVSSQTGFNHHLRYVLPCLPFAFIWMGQVLPWIAESLARKMVMLFVLGTSILASCCVFPHSHAYFNALAGGPMSGHHHMLDSNIDWGQDILLLADWIEAHPERPIDGVAYSLDWLINRHSLGVTDKNPPPGFLGRNTDSIDHELFGPKAGRYAVFVRSLREDSKTYEYFRFFDPVEVLGFTVYIYEIDDDDVARYWGAQTKARSASNDLP